jgi:hypothetical protein
MSWGSPFFKSYRKTMLNNNQDMCDVIYECSLKRVKKNWQTWKILLVGKQKKWNSTKIFVAYHLQRNNFN